MIGSILWFIMSSFVLFSIIYNKNEKEVRGYTIIITAMILIESFNKIISNY